MPRKTRTIAELLEDLDKMESEVKRSHEFIREVAWKFSEHANSNWSSSDVLAHVADFFGITVKDLDQQMESVR